MLDDFLEVDSMADEVRSWVFEDDFAASAVNSWIVGCLAKAQQFEDTGQTWCSILEYHLTRPYN
jgi:hypothetical protein